MQAVKRINEQQDLIKMLPKDQATSEDGELILELQERLIRAKTQEEEFRAVLFQTNEKHRETINELEKLKVENLSLKAKQTQIESKQGMMDY